MTFFRQEEETILLFETITHHQMRIFQSMKVITNLLMISGTLEKYSTYFLRNIFLLVDFPYVYIF